MRKLLLSLAPAVLVVGLLIWEGCSGDAPVAGPASKPTTASFEPDPSTNYDPFRGSTPEERKAALGDKEGALEYFALVARHLARSMNDPAVREVLAQSVLDWDKGEVKLSQVAIDNPQFLRTISSGLRDSLRALNLQNDLSSRLFDSPYDEQALLQVAGAMFDLEIVLVTPPDREWDSLDPIPVFFDPINSDAETVNGFDPDLNSVSLSASITEAPYPFLGINFNEDVEPADPGPETTYRPSSTLEAIWGFSLASPAFAHNPNGHGTCYKKKLIQPVKAITIYQTHETGFWNDPEIEVHMGFSQEKVEGHVFRTEDVNKKFKKYTSYGRWRTTHGDCGKNTNWKVLEMDPWPNDDDLMGKWYGVNLSGTRNLTAVGEVWLVVRETNEG